MYTIIIKLLQNDIDQLTAVSRENVTCKNPKRWLKEQTKYTQFRSEKIVSPIPKDKKTHLINGLHYLDHTDFILLQSDS